MSTFAKTSPAPLLAIIVILLVGSSPAHAGFVRQGGPICTAAGDQEKHAMAPCPGGGAIIVWEDNRGYTDLYAQKIDNYGRIKWTLNGAVVCNYSYGQYTPSIASDGLGGAFIAWQDGRPNTHRDIYVQHIDANGAALWTANGVVVCAAASDQSEPRVVADGFGGCIVGWVDGRVGLPQTDVYAQRVRADGNVAWAANGIPLCVAAGIQQELRAVPDAKGGAFFAWSDYRSDGDIYAQKVRPDGVVAWPTDGRAVSNATGVQQYPDMAMDNRYGAILTWSDRRVGYDIYTQRIDSLGSGRWTANGVALCVEGTWQNYPKVAVDEEGGAIFAWLDQRASGFDCYAQRVGPNGAVKWATDGIAVCTAAGNCNEIQILPIFGKGAGIIWYDSRNVYGDIYAQGIDSMGTALLDPNGDVVCDTTGAQQMPLGVTDGAGGAILAWEDLRGGSESDLYAARINAQGELVATLLQSYAAVGNANGVEITWTLSAVDPDVGFVVLRATAENPTFVELDASEISRDGMAFSFIDRSTEPGVSYIYRVDVSDESGRRELFETDAVTVPAAAFALYQNNPNPFNPSTTIRFYLPEKRLVTLDVYDVTGTLIARLADGYRERGTHSVQWNGRDGKGNQVSSGLYFYRLIAGKEVISRKMVLLR